MNIAIKLIVATAQALLAVINVCMLIRAVLSWFPISDDNPILSFVCMVTEPIVAPIRKLFERMGWFRNSPLDFSFLVAYLLLSAVSTLLGVAV